MFRQLTRLLLISATVPRPTAQVAAEEVLALHPMQISRYLEEVWVGRNTSLLAPGGLEIPPTVAALGLERTSGIAEQFQGAPAGTYPPGIWDHLSYAYMVENTRVYEIFWRVLQEFAYGERLGVPRAEAQAWLRTTEALFYRDTPPFQIYAMASWIRPDIRAVRRNAYQRMLGLDLNHGTDDNRPYPYPRAAAANTDFTRVFEEVLREAWRALENITNQTGPNQTDVSTIANLAQALYDMLRVRRQEYGNLARDELLHVSTMAWLHLTLSYDTPIVRDLKAEATSAAERLQKIGERVGLPAHSRSDSYFSLAESVSLILRELELGTFNGSDGARRLFTPAVPPDVNPFQAALQETITHWSIATGRDVKTRPVSLAATQPTPVRPTPRPPMRAPASSNGRGTVTRETLEV